MQTKINFSDKYCHPDKYANASSVEIVSKGKPSVLQESLINVCERGGDQPTIEVKARIYFAGYIHTGEAKSHHTCLQSFLSG